RDIVIEAVEICSWLRRLLRRRTRGRLLLTLRRRALLARRGVATTGVIGTTTEQLHGALHVDNDFGGVALDAVLFPLTGLQFALDVHLRTFTQVFAGDLGNLAEQRHTVPLGFLDLLT